MLKRISLLLAGACMAANGWWLYSNISHLTAATGYLERTSDIQLLLSSVQSDVLLAETGQRGYVLAGAPSHLQTYYTGRERAFGDFEVLRESLADEPEMDPLLAQLWSAVDAKFEEMARVLGMMALEGQGAAIAGVASGEGQAMMDTVRETIGEIQASIQATLAQRRADVDTARYSAQTAVLAFVIGTLILAMLLYVTMQREVRRRAEGAAEIESYARSLKTSLAELKRERNEIRALNEAGGYMQSCDSVAELTALLSPILERMFADFTGQVLVHAPSRNRLDSVCAFGGGEAVASIAPSECWGLRRGQDHVHLAESAAPSCQHVSNLAEDTGTLCVPLVAHGDTIGLISLQLKPAAMRSAPAEDVEAIFDNARRLANMVGTQLGLTLSNLNLRESLRQQAIRDALTNAFNRRYLDGIGDKILAQASRFGQSLAVVMLDVDHFKQFNDLHGHLAGDHALIAVSRFIQSQIRGADWLFRYGGEEFLIILQGLDRDDARAKLDALREGVAAIQLTHGDAVLPSVTISLGCAFNDVPDASLPDLISLADEALYLAKHNGRNRLQVASSPGPTTVAA